MTTKKERLMNVRRKKVRAKTGKALFCAVIILFVIFIGRFFYIGLLHTASGVSLTKKTKALYANNSLLKAKRGTIYASNGASIVEDTTNYSVYIVLSKSATFNGKKEYLEDSQKENAARVLSENLKIPYSKILSLLHPKDKSLYQVELGNAGKNLSLETKKAIESHHITGINFTSSKARLYPNGIFASHMIGLAESVSDEFIGVMGLEKYYNKYLTGIDGVDKYITDSQGKKIVGTKSKYSSEKNGDSIYTTLDVQLQTYLENLMTKVHDKYQPKTMTAIVIDAKTGAILSASQRPTFNPQTRVGLNEMWRNALLSDDYEPGSTMKIFTMAAAIDSGIYKQNAWVRSGEMDVNGSKIYDWNRSGWGYITYENGFVRSSNVAMASLEQQMGEKRWLEYIKKFGFLQKADLNLGDESSGSISYKYPIEQANTAYGQGINVTAMQMIQGFTAIANNGKELKPYMISKVENPKTKKIVYSQSKKIIATPIKPQSAKKVRDMMREVVLDKDGTGKSFKIDNYDVGVKTGTAQITNPNGGGYLNGETNYIFSVVGMAPISNPRYIVYVTMKQPKNLGPKGSSGDMLAEVFNPMMARALKSERNSAEGSPDIDMIDVTNSSTKAAEDELKKIGLNVSIIGNGNKILTQSIKPSQRVIKNARVLLKTNGGLTMPDVTGWSRNDLIKLQKLTKVRFKINGSGYVKSQSVAPNTNLENIKNIEVNLN